MFGADDKAHVLDPCEAFVVAYVLGCGTRIASGWDGRDGFVGIVVEVAVASSAVDVVDAVG